MYGHEPTIFILGVYTHMATIQPQTNMNTGQQMTMTGMHATDTKHGGHELMDVHEVLSCMVSTLDQYLLFGQQAKDPELKSMITRQHQFMLDTYNILVQCFKSGMNPSHHTTRYAMTQSNDVMYGLTPGQPKKPKMNASEIGDQCISNYMLGLMKADSRGLTMASLEVTNPVVRRVIADSVPNFVEMAYEIFQYQNKHGYYQVPRLDQQDMETLINSFVPSTTNAPIQ